MRINIIFFSSTGNTFYLALQAKYIFEKEGHRVGLYDSVTAGYSEVVECDKIGFFFPSWMSDMPDHMQDFCRNLLSDPVKRDIFIIGNCASGTDNSPNHYRKKLRKAGHTVCCTAMLKMPSNCNIPFLAREVSESQINELKARASESLRKICFSILNGENKQLKNTAASTLASFQRMFFFLKNKNAHRHLKLNLKRCNNCMLCVRLCPVNNITSDENGAIKFGKNCILCTKCYNYCPSFAVLIGKRTDDFRKYQRYICREVKPIFYR